MAAKARRIGRIGVHGTWAVRVVLVAVLAACDANGDDGGTDQDAGSGDASGHDAAQACTDGALRCDGDRLEECRDGAWTLQEDCAQSGWTCGEQDAAAACVEPPCDTGNRDCLDDRLMECSDGEWVLLEDCAANGQICRPMLGGLPQCADEEG